jgi:phage terminase small subunit
VETCQKTGKPAKITPRQERFCQEYATTHNGAEAARKAGYSEKAAKEQASLLLTKTNIQARVADIEGGYLKRLNITKEAVLSEIRKIAFSDMRNFADWGPGGVTLRDSQKLDDNAAACVAEVSESPGENGPTIRFKLHDKRSALELLGRHLALFTDNLNVRERKIVIGAPPGDNDAVPY